MRRIFQDFKNNFIFHLIESDSLYGLDFYYFEVYFKIVTRDAVYQLFGVLLVFSSLAEP